MEEEKPALAPALEEEVNTEYEIKYPNKLGRPVGVKLPVQIQTSLSLEEAEFIRELRTKNGGSMSAAVRSCIIYKMKNQPMP
jgi:hypothetical protein